MRQVVARFALPVVLIALAAGFVANRLTTKRGSEATAAASMPAVPVRLDSVSSERTAVFAGGCFWGIEAVFEHLRGVKSAESGYAGGSTASPTYEDVSAGETGHAEAVRVNYDPSQISYEQLLQVFFAVAHDPTQLNRQGPDVGTQYRSAIFYSDTVQKRAAAEYVSALTTANVFKRPIVTEIAPLSAFHLAEAYHQDYMAHHPNQMYIVINDAPKVAHLREQFPALYRDTH